MDLRGGANLHFSIALTRRGLRCETSLLYIIVPVYAPAFADTNNLPSVVMQSCRDPVELAISKSHAQHPTSFTTTPPMPGPVLGQ